MRGFRGGGGKGYRPTPPPPVKYKFYGFLYGISNCPPPPWKKVGHPTPWKKCWTPSRTLENYYFFLNKLFGFCKISWGQKKKTKKTTFSEIFIWQMDLGLYPPSPNPDGNSWIRACIDTNLEILLLHLCWNSIIIIAGNFSWKGIAFYDRLHIVPHVFSVKLGGIICQNSDSKWPFIYLELDNISVYMEF